MTKQNCWQHFEVAIFGLVHPKNQKFFSTKTKLQLYILLKVFFSCFHAQKNIVSNLLLHCRVRTKQLLWMNVRFFFHWMIYIIYHSDVKRRIMYQNWPSKSHHLPFDQRIQIVIPPRSLCCLLRQLGIAIGWCPNPRVWGKKSARATLDVITVGTHRNEKSLPCTMWLYSEQRGIYYVYYTSVVL